MLEHPHPPGLPPEIEAPSPDSGPAWLRHMVRVIGTKEQPGAADNPMIIDAAAFIGMQFPELKAYSATYKHDETPWCGLAAAWGVTKAGIMPPMEYLASVKWREWGYDVKSAERGAIACLDGHVAYVYLDLGSTIYLVGGNQSDAVTVMPVNASSVLAYRWPAPEDYRTGYYPDDDRVT
jgi:uncharacterized protein (TIGR02594 family)